MIRLLYAVEIIQQGLPDVLAGLLHFIGETLATHELLLPMMSVPPKPDSANTSSVQSTPTPPNSGQSTRSRRSLRKCATPIKSAEKVEKGERVAIPQFSLSDTSSTNNTITPDSAHIVKPKQPKPAPATPSATPIRRQTSSTPRKKGRKRIPFTLVEASKGNRCPTPNCNGHGHVTGLYAMHYAVSGCPIAARNRTTTLMVTMSCGAYLAFCCL